MGPTDFYQNQYIIGTGIGEKRRKITHLGSNLKFYNESLEMKFLNHEYWNNIGGVSEEKLIADYQYHWAKKTWQVKGVIKDFVNSYNKKYKKSFGITGFDKSNPSLNLEKAMEIFSKTFKNFAQWYDPTKGMQFSNLRSSELLYRQSKKNGAITINSETISSYKDLAKSLFEVEKILKNMDFISEQDITSIITNIKNARGRLEADLKNYDVNLPISTEAYFSPEELNNLNHGIQGALFESAVFSWLKSALPQSIKILNTASLKNATTGSNITGGSDLIGIDTNGFNIDITKIPMEWEYDDINGNRIKTKGTMADFINILEKDRSTTVFIEQSEYSKLFESQHNFGITAKSGFNQDIVNKRTKHNQISIDDNTYLAGNTIASQALRVFLRWYKYNHIKTNNKYYNLYFDYNLAHLLGYVIGEHSSITATREGIQTTPDYLREQWLKHKKYVKAIKQISLRSPTKLNKVGLSAANPFK